MQAFASWWGDRWPLTGDLLAATCDSGYPSGGLTSLGGFHVRGYRAGGVEAAVVGRVVCYRTPAYPALVSGERRLGLRCKPPAGCLQNQLTKITARTTAAAISHTDICSPVATNPTWSGLTT